MSGASSFVDSAEIATQSGGGGGGSVPAFAPAAKSGPAHAAPSVRDRTDEVPPALLSRLARVVAVPAVTDPVVVVATPDKDGRGGLRIISRPRFRSDHRWRPCRGWCRRRREVVVVVVVVVVVRVGGDRSDHPKKPAARLLLLLRRRRCVAVVASPSLRPQDERQDERQQPCNTVHDDSIDGGADEEQQHPYEYYGHGTTVDNYSSVPGPHTTSHQNMRLAASAKKQPPTKMMKKKPQHQIKSVPVPATERTESSTSRQYIPYRGNARQPLTRTNQNQKPKPQPRSKNNEHILGGRCGTL